MYMWPRDAVRDHAFRPAGQRGAEELGVTAAGVAIELETNHRGVDPDRRDFDAWFAYTGETAAPRPVTCREDTLLEETLYEEELLPVCSPALLAARGRASNRKISAKVEKQAVAILSKPLYAGFGPTLAAEYLQQRHGIRLGRETLRGWMAAAGLWKPRRRNSGRPHLWRPRRCCRGELVQWDTSEHDWLEERGEKLYLIGMIDDASSELLARFVGHDSSEENRRLLRTYLEKNGRPAAFYTDRASLFVNTPKNSAGEDPKTLPPTQIGRALEELGIESITAYSPQAKGRVERSFGTAQDRLVKGLRVTGASTDQASQRLSGERVSAHLIIFDHVPSSEAPGRVVNRPATLLRNQIPVEQPSPNETGNY